MPFVRVNDVDLFTQDEHHTGEAAVLVHGSWDDHTAWNAVAPLLSERFRVVRYDRRGYGRTERPAGPRLRRQDEDDLAGLIEALDCAPAHVIGHSFGASTALGLALRRPELLASLSIHEPPLIGAASEDSRLRPQLDEVTATIGAAAAQLRDGDAGRRRKALRRGRGARPRGLAAAPARGARAGDAQRAGLPRRHRGSGMGRSGSRRGRPHRLSRAGYPGKREPAVAARDRELPREPNRRRPVTTARGQRAPPPYDSPPGLRGGSRGFPYRARLAAAARRACCERPRSASRRRPRATGRR